MHMTWTALSVWFTRTTTACNRPIRAERLPVETRCVPLGGDACGHPRFCAEVLRSIHDADTIWTEWHWSGMRSDGQLFEVRGVTLFQVVDDQIVAGRLYLEDVERDAVGIEDAVVALSGRRPQPGPRNIRE
jgi:hypothetical protein